MFAHLPGCDLTPYVNRLEVLRLHGNTRQVPTLPIQDSAEKAAGTKRDLAALLRRHIWCRLRYNGQYAPDVRGFGASDQSEDSIRRN